MANEQIIGQVSTPDNVAAVLGHHTAAGFGVHGHAEDGFTAGVRGTHNGPIGHGVQGEAATGVFGKSNTGDGRGVSGEGKTGVFGLSTGGGHGVVGQVPDGPTAGVFGHGGPSGHGVRGEGGIGVLGTSSRTGFAAVAGDHTGAGVGVVGDVAQGGDGTAGVLGRHKAGGVGVRGEGKIGVLGKQTSPDGHGVRGEGVIGVIGASFEAGFAAVFGDHTGAGVGVVGDVAQGGDGTAGVLGRHKGDGPGVKGEGRTGVLGEGSPGVVGICGSSLQAGSTPLEHHGNAAGVSGKITGIGNGPGVFGEGRYGGEFKGSKIPFGAQLRLVPATTVGRPTTEFHRSGEIFMDSAATLFVCTAEGTPGKWVRVRTEPA
jgi:hypothetical protein